jgi:hypothetical protein
LHAPSPIGQGIELISPVERRQGALLIVKQPFYASILRNSG